MRSHAITTPPRPHWNPVQAAAYDLVHTFQDGDLRGAVALAPKLKSGKSPTLLSNEVNPDYPGAKFGLTDAVETEIVAGRFPILHAYALMTGHVVYPVPRPDLNVCDVELLTLFSQWQAAMGVTCTEIHEALSPKGPRGSRISTAEADRIHAAGQRHMMRFMEFLMRVRAIAED